MHSRGKDKIPNPNGCRWCGVDKEDHLQRWDPNVKWHTWVEPTVEQRKKRMHDRQAQRRLPPEGLLAS